MGLVDGKFIDENEVTAQVGSLIPSSWANALTDEVLAVQGDAGLEADEANHAQLLAAIKLIIARMGQASYSSPVGTARNAQMSITAATKTATFTADEIILSTALGGQTYRLAAFNKTVDLATVGAGGMDTGTAPVSGFVALYAIYNPTTGASALLAVNATAAKASEVYGGNYMPAGYTASALVSVWGTNGSGQFFIGYQAGRHINTNAIALLSTTTAASAWTALSLAGAVPRNARSVDVDWQISNSSGSSSCMAGVASTSSGLAVYSPQIGASSATITAFGAGRVVDIVTAQTIYYTFTFANASTLGLYSLGYTI